MTDALDDSSASGRSFREEILASPPSPHLEDHESDSHTSMGADVKSPAAKRAPSSLPPPCSSDASQDSPEESPVLELYRKHRSELEAFLKEEGNIFARGTMGGGGGGGVSEKGEYVGLANQGATCYLNSLVQALFMLPPFRRRILEFKHDPSLHGSLKGSIPGQLQRLFAQLRLSSRPHVSTKPLTRSFGWGSAEGFQQHDVQELLVQVLDALERSRTSLKGLFEGTMSNYIRGEGFDRRSTEPFTTLMLPIRGHDTLEKAIRSYFEPDRLEGDNQYMNEDLGKKVDALKGAEVVKLPPVLVINLGRFLFDYTTMRRVKINDVCSFPETLDMDTVLKGFRCRTKKSAGSSNGCGGEQQEEEVSENTDTNKKVVGTGAIDGTRPREDDPFGNYDLVATMVHSGTTHGGHYRAFIRGDREENRDHWFNFNDSFVSRLDQDEVRTMFGRDPSLAMTSSPKKPNSSTPGDADDSNKDAPDQEKERLAHVSRSCCNSYMLIYRKREPLTNTNSEKHISETFEEENKLIPKSLRTEILQDNAKVDLMSSVYEARSKIARLTVCLGNRDFSTIEVLRTATLKDATNEAVRALLGRGDTEYHLDLTSTEHRLRVFDPQSSRPGRTFGSDQINSTLVDIGLANGSYTLLLESRNIETDPPFEDYDPLDFYIQLLGWDSSTLSTCSLEGAGGGAPILVAGKQRATVGQMLDAVSSATNTDIANFNVLLLVGGEAKILDESMRDKELKKDLQIWSGGSLVFENVEGSMSGVSSTVANEYEDSQNKITIRFNAPGTKAYDIELACDKRDTLADVKAAMAPLIGFDGKENNSEGKPTLEHFRCRCNARAPVLKKLDETLGDIGLSRGSILHLEKGAQIREGQVVVKFYIYNPSPPKGKKPFIAALKMPVDKTATVADVKMKLVTSRKFSSHPPQRLRLHIKKKGQSDVGPLLRDDVTMEYAGGRGKRLSDETMFAVRFLERPETVTKSDVIVKVRHWSPLTADLQRGEDVVVPKRATVTEFSQKIYELKPFRNDSVAAANEGELRQVTFMAKSHISSANHMDLRKKALAASRGSSGRMIQWVELPPLEREAEEDKEGVDNMGSGLSKNQHDGEALPASAVGAPVKLSGQELVMKTPLGMLRDGDVFFTHFGEDLAQALAKWTAPDGEETAASGNSLSTGMRKNPNWKPGGQKAVASSRRFPPRREVGIKIRTEFDADISVPEEAQVDPSSNEVAQEDGLNSSVNLPVDSKVRPAGSAVEAVRLRPKT